MSIQRTEILAKATATAFDNQNRFAYNKMPL